jgi:hypothetical protein
MRAPFLILPLTLALAAPLSLMAEETSRVLFCSGDCFTMDANGVRTAAPKGTPLLPGQRLETGPGSYAQVRLGADAAFGVDERARVRLDDKGVFLDEGRIRVIGKAAARPVELRTDDSAFVLRGADIEMKKSGPSGPASPILVKLNAGHASVSGEALANGGVQLVTAGSIIPGAPLASTDLASGAVRRSSSVAQAGGLPRGLGRLPARLTPVALAPMKAPLPPVARGPVPPTLTLPPALQLIPRAPEPSPLPMAPRLLAEPVMNLKTGEITTLNAAIVKTIDPTYISPTLSTSRLTLSTSTPTTQTTLSSPTTTYKLLSPTLTISR